ncbi:MAG: FKBP-type peptidyl-prolyl cis-trans isomerase [Nitrospiraceae bacterium]|nr:FKBP-type peptidyl-prolyl cis-trans isomerase [Nitrospiraceae bacterium]
MRLVWMTVMGCLLLAGSVFAEEQKPLSSQKDKASYVLGTDVGNTLKRQGIEVDLEIFIKGIRDAVQGSKPLLSEEETKEVIMAFRQDMLAKQAEQRKKLGEKNKKDGEAFLAENKKKEGVKTLPSGLQYKVISEGAGKMPKLTDTATVNYRGTLIDGTEFDSSYKRGQPATFPVNGVIPGWTEALQLMKEGSKWELFIPADLAYGDKGAGNVIGPDAVLIFQVELISVESKAVESKPAETKAAEGKPAEGKSEQK